MQIYRHVNTVLNSNSYLLTTGIPDEVWIIDPGDGELIAEWIQKRNLAVKGILITHCHFDHICGTNVLIGAFPKAVIYASRHAAEGMRSPKINASYYTETIFELNREANVEILENGMCLPLGNDLETVVLSTPGHSNDSVTYAVMNNVFTGDALIPGVEVYSKKYKTGNRQDSVESQRAILGYCQRNSIIFPGHGAICPVSQVQRTPFSQIEHNEGFEILY